MIGNIPRDKSIPIIIHGAGISGLVVAYYLKKSGRNITIYENNKVGGLIQTYKAKNCYIEPAAHTIYTNKDILDLIHDLKLDYIKSPSKLKKFIFRNSKISKPLTLKEIITIVPNVFKKTPQNIVTIKDFLSPLLSEEIIDDVVSSALTGIYSMGADDLHFYSVFKKEAHGESYFKFFKSLFGKKDSERASISFQGGISTFIRTLENELIENIKYEPCSIDEKGHHLICTSAYDAALILKPKYPVVADLLSSIPYLKLAATTFVTKNRSLDLENSFGVLVPKSANLKIKGIVSSSEVFPALHNQGFHSYKTIHSIAPKDDIRAEFNYLLGHLDIDEELTTEWQRSIPAYNLERFELIKKIKELPMNNVTLFGNYIQGISIRDLVSSAKKLAD